MNEPAALHVELQPSGFASAAVVVGVVATSALVVWLPLDPWLQAVATTTLGAYGIALNRSWAQRSTSGAVLAIVLDANRHIAVIARSGRRCEGEVQNDSYVGTLLTTIVWRRAGQRRSHAIAILPDMLLAEDFHKLRRHATGTAWASPAATPARR
jgi:hypothetical protein